MLEVKKLKKKFGSNVVLNDISFNVSKGDIISIVGPSGSGKSTLLRCLNLIEKPSSGDIIFEGISLIGKKTDLSLLRQKMGMVFQQFNLFPHLTVIDNITLAPVKLKLMNEVTARKKALELLNTINLKDKAEHYPNELSGGQKQRVAIIRTLIMEPDIILFDEPTSALDPEMIGEVLDLIKKVADTGKTMVIVSHEMNFVKKVSNRVLFINGGKVIFDGKTKDFFSSENIRIKEFLDKIKK
ncbi:MAG: amino acid ABC transporter ATP-binding protein [Firmicutes bacterium]|nr:amino acid ABC transporter ATP-binding protein [Bacillota bacterium]MDY5335227.1 amino acid ABC transporter ATP-binding protein [Bacilli bacterium]